MSDDRVSDVRERDGAEGPRGSARGWHTVQLAVFGFVGLCGVLKSGTPPVPRWLEAAAGVLVLAALAVACWATYLVGRVAWPLPGRALDAARAGRRLRSGLWLTFLAVLLVAVATATAWWPSPADANGTALVRVTTSAGSVCGTLGSGAGHGRVRVLAGGRALDVPLARVTRLSPAGGCP
ncbi:hypothetical protein I3F58_05195 [Streptomyces sp. MUM 203J]|uniref:hypothetical protein n=1 Tax=Streptomyces sp. MUM 203J TaxID=2791990 RepID=UPI001F04B90C|nr:hypothetical protein [Streptomyces sp. MUM 203J]MCH0538959.1 hypothetical protein [Streptomyces sp. MUM 203J]